MIKEDVKHLFDRSACLNKRQFEAYLSGNMITEEVYGIEHHINGCPLCSMAMDGMQMRKDALEVASGLNTDFIKDHFAMMPQQSSSGASYIKNLKPKEINTKPLMTTVKVLVAVGACAAILWFVQSVGKNNSNAPVEETKQEEVVNVATPPQQEEQQVIVEEPLMADTTQAAEPVPEAAPVQEKPAIGPPEDKPVVATKPAATTPAVSTKPVVTTKPVVAVAKPVAPVTKPVATTTKPVTTTTKPTTVPTKPVATKPTAIPNLAKPTTTTAPPPVVREIPRDEPKPVVKQEEKPAPREEAKPTPPAPKKEEVSEDLPSDPIAAGKALMDKRSYNAAINKMRNEMRSNNKGRRQEAVLLVARCYQAMGNKDRAAELLKSVVDEGGPEKKNAKKLLKEVDKNAVKDDE